MKINSTNPISFKSHYYNFQPITEDIQIVVDNNDVRENFGNFPIIRGNYKSEEISGNYTSDVPDTSVDDGKFSYYFYGNKPFYYNIYYEDSGKTDSKNGKNYLLNTDDIKDRAFDFLKSNYNVPDIDFIKRGNVKAKVKKISEQGSRILSNEELNRIFSEVKEPTVIIYDGDINLNTDIISNKNILGIITNKNISMVTLLSHYGSQLRHSFLFMCFCYNKKLFDELSSLDGKYVEFNCSQNNLTYKETDNTNLSTPKENEKIELPRLKYCERILDSNEYTQELVGAKAYNLSRLEQLVREGKIDCIIPKSISLPFGYLDNFIADSWQKLKENEPEKFDYYSKTRAKYKNKSLAPYSKNSKPSQLNEIMMRARKEGIKGNNLMVRSAFACEDIDGFSAAGLFKSSIAKFTPDSIYNSINIVLQSKYLPISISLTKKYGVKQDEIIPTIIIQDRINADYRFTLYTDMKDNCARLEMIRPSKYEYQNSIKRPYVYIYNKTTGEINYISTQLNNDSITYDENGKIIKTPEYINLSQDKKMNAMVKKLFENAMVIEKELKYPQDIEGGFLGDNIYLWQTRNIVY